jgi:DNA polymerase-3 subunit epsilon
MQTQSSSLCAFLDMVRVNNFVVLDTETAGLHNGEVVQIAVVESSGAVLVDTLVKPVYPIPADASAIHGITDADVADAPSWSQVSQMVEAVLRDRDVVVYNAVYDRKMLHQSAEKAGLPKIDWKVISRWHCAMEMFAEVYGEWNDYHQSYRWQRLTTAARHYRLPVFNAHSALGDCLMTLAVVKAMAGVQS